MIEEILTSRWGRNLEKQLNFWSGTFKRRAKFFNKERPLNGYFGQMIGARKKVDILDVGSGMFATIGNTWPTATINITACDALADEYQEIFKNHGVIPYIKIEKQNMEALTYRGRSFDIVNCNNALDHCVNPRKAIGEMIRVCRPGGHIYLRHSPNEGLTHRYAMQHQWNIVKVFNDCLFWNKFDKFLLSEIAPGFKTTEKIELANEPITIVSILQKQ